MKHRSTRLPKSLLGGPRGPRGDQGLSAYGVWLQAGNTGTVDDFFGELSSNRPYIHLTRDGADGVFSIRMQNEISYGDEGVLIRRAGVYRADYFCPGTGAFCLLKNGVEVPASRFFGEESPWGMALVRVSVEEGPVRLQLQEEGKTEGRRGVFSVMRIGPVVAQEQKW